MLHAWKEDECMQGFDAKPLNEGDQWEYLNVVGRIILMWILDLRGI
jgi:hypothetical protein